MRPFKVVSDYEPSGDQPEAIKALADGVLAGDRFQTLKGVTGSGKTFTMAKIIEKVQRPTLVMSHNKTLAAQLYREFKSFFPDNAVEYFVSYYDYYQPEAYVPARDLYIEKDAAINDEIDRMRLSATFSLMERRDVIVVSTVSCIYGLGMPESYRDMRIHFDKGDKVDLGELKKKLVSLQYERNDAILERGRFRARGDTLEIFPAYLEEAYRLEFDWDTLTRIKKFDPISGETTLELDELSVYPAKHFVMKEDAVPNALQRIREQLDEQLARFKAQGKILEAERLKTRTEYDLEMLGEMGYCPGI
ncbi:MAG TPA: DEAD/DEAH box helicase family protein, partial [Treponemataceae bacterium]|nr:DEAD/DEAH box helicase family protein [Treponemataceae bacterium]